LTLRAGPRNELAQYDNDQVAFWDLLHPSAATHGILGAYTAHALEHDPVGLSAGADSVGTGSGSNLVLALAGNDAISLGDGADLAFGGSGEDVIRAGKGNDLVSGGSQNDLLKGQRGKDVLDGDESSDLVSGGRAGDVLIDGLGSDQSRGGGGADQFLFTEAELIGGNTGPDADLFKGGKGADTLWLALSHATARKLRDELTGPDPQEALAALGIEVRGVEEIRVVKDREGLAALDDEPWYQQADLWGLI
jgi:Ca2+-binding RTX toxin-like protein